MFVFSVDTCFESLAADGNVNLKLPRFHEPLEVPGFFKQSVLVGMASQKRFAAIVKSPPSPAEGALARAAAGQDKRNDPSAWVSAIGQEYTMSNQAYRIAMAVRYGCPLPDAVRPGHDHAPIAGNMCDCAKRHIRIDPHGYHLLDCGKGGGRTRIHDAVNRELARGLRQLGVSVRLEKPYNAGLKQRADLIARDNENQLIHYDLVTTWPLSTHQIDHPSQATHSVTGADVARAEAGKITLCGTTRQYPHLAQDGPRAARNGYYQFYPLGINLLGVWGHGLQHLFGKSMHDAVEAHELTPAGAARYAARFRRRISVTLQRAVAEAVMMRCEQIRHARTLVMMPRAHAPAGAAASAVVAHRPHRGADGNYPPRTPPPRVERGATGSVPTITM